jgi:hypothetical protein
VAYDAAMPTTKPTKKPSTVFKRIAPGRWSATLQTASGLITAVGESQGEAQSQLDELITMRSALKYTRDNTPKR